MLIAAKNEPEQPCHAPTGVSLARGALHEIYAGSEADGGALSALALVLGDARAKRARLWVRHAACARETGTPHPAGLAALGFDPADLVLVKARDVQSALQAGLEGARCAALGAVIVELWGDARAYDLTASRRFALAAKSSGVRVLLARHAAMPLPSAAETRWRVQAAASRALLANAPGFPAFDLLLLRARNGQEGLRYHLEWDCHARSLVTRLSSAASAQTAGPSQPAPLSGAVVAFSPHGSNEDILQRRAG